MDTVKYQETGTFRHGVAIKIAFHNKNTRKARVFKDPCIRRYLCIERRIRKLQTHLPDGFFINVKSRLACHNYLIETKRSVLKYCKRAGLGWPIRGKCFGCPTVSRPDNQGLIDFSCYIDRVWYKESFSK